MSLKYNFLNWPTVFALRMSFGSEFHRLGAADINARSPSVLSDFNFGFESSN